MNIVTAEQMQRIDAYTIHSLGIPEMVLMENAGRCAVQKLLNLHRKKSGKWLILVGKGNNGGDGLVMARALLEQGHEPVVLLAQSPEKRQGSFAAQLEVVRKLPIQVMLDHTGESIAWKQFDGVIDALLGTGTKGKPREPYATLIRAANESGRPIYAVDLPSGLDADSGLLYDPCMKATATFALAMLKRGHAIQPGREQCGQILLCPIGIPQVAMDAHDSNTYLLSETVLKRIASKWYEPRQADSHKGRYGHVITVAGSTLYSGAGLLCSQSAMRMGAGYVTWMLPEKLFAPMCGHAPELILSPIADQGTGTWQHVPPALVAEQASDKQCTLIGCGLGRFAQDTTWLIELLKNISNPLVLDADALNILADSDLLATGRLPAHKADIVITPHPGEMARLMRTSVQTVQANRVENARRFAQQHGIYVVLKGASTVVASPDGTAYINESGNPNMAVAGMGDVLAGMIAGVWAQNFTPLQACLIAVYYHGAWCDQIVADTNKPYALTVSDLIDKMSPIK